MAKLLIYTYFYIAIWSKEHEPPHVHVYKLRSRQLLGARFFIKNNQIILDRKGEFNKMELNEISKIIRLYLPEIKEMLNLHKEGKKITPLKITKQNVKHKIKQQ